MEKDRVFRCASCGREFRLPESERTFRCPDCRGRTLILLEGESVAKKKCAGCSASSCST